MRRRQVCGTVAAALLLVLVFPGAANAHATYKDSDPPDEGVVHEAPAEVRAEFTEPPTDTSYLEIYNECGEQVDSGDTSSVGYDMIIGLEDDSKGLYTVRYVVQSRLDSHVTEGEFTFTAHGGSSCSGAPAGGPREEPDDDPEPDDEPPPQEGEDPSGDDGPHDHDDTPDDSSTDATQPQPTTAPGAGTSGPSSSPPGASGAANNGSNGTNNDSTESGKTPRASGTTDADGRRARAGGGRQAGPQEAASDDDAAATLEQAADFGTDAGSAAPQPYVVLVLLALMVIVVPVGLLVRSIVDSPDDRAGSPFGSMWTNPPG